MRHLLEAAPATLEVGVRVDPAGRNRVLVKRRGRANEEVMRAGGVECDRADREPLGRLVLLRYA